MEITAWDIYWVMQLDSFSAFSFTLALVLSLLSLFGCISIWWNKDFAELYEDMPESRSYKKYIASANTGKKLAVRTFPFAIAFAFLSAILPSSKTAAAMLIIPAIANSVTIQNEAKDIYALAKQGLSELVKPDQPKPEKKD